MAAPEKPARKVASAAVGAAAPDASRDGDLLDLAGLAIDDGSDGSVAQTPAATASDDGRGEGRAQPAHPLDFGLDPPQGQGQGSPEIRRKAPSAFPYKRPSASLGGDAPAGKDEDAAVDDVRADDVRADELLSNPPVPPFAATSQFWRDLGFQSDDPQHEFRGTGMLGLQCLLHFVAAHPATARALMRSPMPFAASSINVTGLVARLVGLTAPTEGDGALSGGLSGGSGGMGSRRGSGGGSSIGLGGEGSWRELAFGKKADTDGNLAQDLGARLIEAQVIPLNYSR